MAYCEKCGKKLGRDSKFCPNCGEPVTDRLNVSVETEIDADNAEKRRQVFVGLVRKCPSCGAELSSTVAVCPQCGFELNTKRGAQALQEFAEQLNNVDEEIAAAGHTKEKGWSTWGGWKRFGWVVLNIYTLCLPILIPMVLRQIRILAIKPRPRLSALEERKAEIIENYVVPNEKGAMIESLRFIRTKVEALNRQSKSEPLMYWMNLWAVKAGQINSKAMNSLNGDDEIASQYKGINKITKSTNRSMRVGAGFKLAIVLLILFFFIWLFTPTHGQAAKTPAVGLTVSDVTEEDAKECGLESAGVYIAAVNTDSARQAGLQERDRIVSVDGEPVESAEDYLKKVRKHKVGDKITIVVSRDGKEKKAKVKLLELDE